MTRIPVTILTGFLGAGKTTFLNRMMAQPGFKRTAVVVNEFGEAGIDGSLIARADEQVLEMTTGCLCCTVSGDVRQTLMRILDDAVSGRGPLFDRVVIETTGLADPLPLLQTFMMDEHMLRTFTLNGLVTLVDTIHGVEAIKRFPEARRQVAVADLLLITKADLANDTAPQNEVAALKAMLSEYNPTARVEDVRRTWAETLFSLAAFDPAGKPPDVSAWLGFAEQNTPSVHSDHHGHAHDVNKHADSATAFCFTASEPVDGAALDAAIVALQSAFGSNLLRVKGLVDLNEEPGCPRVVHVVGHIANMPRLLDGWPNGIDTTRLVMIIAGPKRNAAPRRLVSMLPEFTPYRAKGATLPVEIF